MTGMFQSSRTASGMASLQDASACSPSSASVIWKSMSSRMRRAIFRTTLESSTTRQVFIFRPPCLSSVTLRGLFSARFRERDRCRGHHELAVETVNAAGQLGHAGIEIDRVFLAAVIVEFQDLADLVDQQAVGLAAQIDADRHRRLAVVVLR